MFLLKASRFKVMGLVECDAIVCCVGTDILEKHAISVVRADKGSKFLPNLPKYTAFYP